MPYITESEYSNLVNKAVKAEQNFDLLFQAVKQFYCTQTPDHPGFEYHPGNLFILASVNLSMTYNKLDYFLKKEKDNA